MTRGKRRIAGGWGNPGRTPLRARPPQSRPVRPAGPIFSNFAMSRYGMSLRRCLVIGGTRAGVTVAGKGPGPIQQRQSDAATHQSPSRLPSFTGGGLGEPHFEPDKTCAGPPSGRARGQVSLLGRVEAIALLPLGLFTHVPPVRRYWRPGIPQSRARSHGRACKSRPSPHATAPVPTFLRVGGVFAGVGARALGCPHIKLDFTCGRSRAEFKHINKRRKRNQLRFPQ